MDGIKNRDRKTVNFEEEKKTEGVQSYIPPLTCNTIMNATMKGVGDVFEERFVAKNFAVTGIQTCNLPSHFFFVAVAPSKLD